MLNLKYKQLETEVDKIISNSIKLLATSSNDLVKSHANKLESELAKYRKKSKLEIAFIGEYSAGKSTIISALTRNDNIAIGADVTTDKVSIYKWGNVTLVDTPGIKAGYEEHDKITLDYINKADLLVYVIMASKGFTASTAADFKKLILDDNRVAKTMLVMNRSSEGNRKQDLNNWVCRPYPYQGHHRDNDYCLNRDIR